MNIASSHWLIIEQGSYPKEMMMFKTILCPMDFSNTTGKKVEYLKKLRKAGAEKIVLLNVIHQRVIDTIETVNKAAYFQDGRYHEDLEESLEKLEKDRRAKFVPIVAELEAAGFEVKTRIQRGHPVKEILKAEKEEAASAIVLGALGRNNIQGARIGSVAEKVLRRAISTVLLVKS
jgi:nucleotide-binding universal stress UspA family protein